MKSFRFQKPLEHVWVYFASIELTNFFVSLLKNQQVELSVALDPEQVEPDLFNK